MNREIEMYNSPVELGVVKGMKVVKGTVSYHNVGKHAVTGIKDLHKGTQILGLLFVCTDTFVGTNGTLQIQTLVGSTSASADLMAALTVGSAGMTVGGATMSWLPFTVVTDETDIEFEVKVANITAGTADVYLILA